MPRDLNKLTETIIAATIAVHREKGPGLLKSTYEACLAHELAIREVSYARQVPVPITYKGVAIDTAFRADMIVENLVLLELKAIETTLPIHKAQLLSYLRETGLPIGLLISFHTPILVQGITRLINDRPSVHSVSSALKLPSQS